MMRLGVHLLDNAVFGQPVKRILHVVHLVRADWRLGRFGLQALQGQFQSGHKRYDYRT